MVGRTLSTTRPTGEEQFVGCQFPGALAGDQPLGIHVPEALLGLLVGKPFFFHPGHDSLGDADTGLTGAQEDDTLFGEGLFGDA